jgi:hypothetical protein
MRREVVGSNQESVCPFAVRESTWADLDREVGRRIQTTDVDLNESGQDIGGKCVSGWPLGAFH